MPIFSESEGELLFGDIGNLERNRGRTRRRTRLESTDDESDSGGTSELSGGREPLKKKIKIEPTENWE